MAVEVHMDSRIERGRFAEFLASLEEWFAYRRAKGWVVPRVLQALSGEMNTVRMVFPYPDLRAYEREEAAVATDREYARVAMKMPFEGSLHFTIFLDTASA